MGRRVCDERARRGGSARLTVGGGGKRSRGREERNWEMEIRGRGSGSGRRREVRTEWEGWVEREGEGREYWEEREEGG
jgi:hypothetical protein